MPDKYMKELNSLIFQFIWKTNRDKLKRSVMIKLMIQTSKINWIKRYLSPPDQACTWKNMVKVFFLQDGVDLDVLLKSDFDLKQFNLTVPTFYIDMLSMWSKISQTEPIEKSAFLWYNKNILTRKKPVYHSEMAQVGINYVNDLFDGNTKKAIPFKVWTDRGLNKSQFMNWVGLVFAARKSLDVITGTNVETLLDKELVYLVQTTPVKYVQAVKSREIYDLLVVLQYSNQIHVPNIVKYIDQTNYDPETHSWEKVYKLIHSSVDVKTKNFQFRFIHDILSNNYWLKKWKITEDDTCVFCKREVENIEHLFWNCTFIEYFWNLFRQTYVEKIDLNIDKNTVFLGSSHVLLHTLICLAKQYIYECKFKECIPFFPQFVSRVNYLQQIELHIARDDKQIEKWIDKWEPLLLL